MQAGEPHLLALAVALHAAADLVFIAQHGAAGRLLPKQDVALGIDVLLHILVVIQMVGGHIGHHRHLGAAAHADQLEAGKLHHSHIIRRNVRQLGQQGCADVAAQKHLAAGSLEIILEIRVVVVVLPSEPVTATISQGQNSKNSSTSLVTMAPGFQGGLQLGLKVLIARCAHDDILPGKAIGIVLAQAQGRFRRRSVSA